MHILFNSICLKVKCVFIYIFYRTRLMRLSIKCRIRECYWFEILFGLYYVNNLQYTKCIKYNHFKKYVSRFPCSQIFPSISTLFIFLFPSFFHYLYYVQLLIYFLLILFRLYNIHIPADTIIY